MKHRIATVSLCLALAGCSASHLVYVHEQTLGVDLALTEQGTNKLNIGYDRESYALVPRVTPKGTEPADAMSLAAITRTYIQGISNIEIGHCIATGTAAEGVAQGATELRLVALRVFGSSRDDDGGDGEGK